MKQKLIIGIDPGDKHTGVCCLSLDEHGQMTMMIEQTFDDRFIFLAWLLDETSSWDYNETDYYVVVEDWRLFNTTEYKTNDRMLAIRVIGMVEAVLGREPYYQNPGIKIPTDIHLGHLITRGVDQKGIMLKRTSHSRDAALHCLHFVERILQIDLR